MFKFINESLTKARGVHFFPGTLFRAPPGPRCGPMAKGPGAKPPDANEFPHESCNYMSWNNADIGFVDFWSKSRLTRVNLTKY